MLKRVARILILLIAIISSESANAKMFGYDEYESMNTSDFKKWRDVLQRHEIQTIANARYLENFRQDVARISKLQTPAEQIVAVNSYFNNKITYDDDASIWGKSDYWATPAETYSIGKGDCDDYVISKYEALKLLGFNTNDMRVVVLKDQRKNQIHAVLAVNYNGANYILDNQSQDVIADTQIAYYQPIYSISESRWWKHS